MFKKLYFQSLCLCASVVVLLSNIAHAQLLSFPATRTDQQHVIQATLQTPLNLRTLCFSADGKTLYVGAYREVLVWSLDQAKLVKRLSDEELTGMVTAMQVLEDGKTLAVSGSSPASNESSVLLFDTASFKRTAILKQNGDTIQCMTVSKEGTELFTGNFSGSVNVWDLKTRKITKQFSPFADAMTDMIFSRDNKWFCVGTRGGQVVVYETTEGYPQKLSKSMNDAVLGLCFDHAKNVNLAIAVGGNKERSVRLLNKKNTRRLRKVGGVPGMPLSICWGPKTNFAFLGGSNNTIVSWNKRAGRIYKTFKGHDDWVTKIALSSDEKILASVSLDGTAKIWDAKTGRLKATLVQLKPQSDHWLMIAADGAFNTSSADVVQFFGQAKDMQKSLCEQWQKPLRVSEALGFKVSQ